MQTNEFGCSFLYLWALVGLTSIPVYRYRFGQKWATTNIEQYERQHRFIPCSRCRTPSTSHAWNHSQLTVTHARCSRRSIKYEYEMKKKLKHIWRSLLVIGGLTTCITPYAISSNRLLLFLLVVYSYKWNLPCDSSTHSRDWIRKPVADANFDMSLRTHHECFMETRSFFSAIGILRRPMSFRFSLFRNISSQQYVQWPALVPPSYLRFNFSFIVCHYFRSIYYYFGAFILPPYPIGLDSLVSISSTSVHVVLFRRYSLLAQRRWKTYNSLRYIQFLSYFSHSWNVCLKKIIIFKNISKKL